MEVLENNSIRPNWDEHFLKMLQIISERSTCNRGKVSCIIVRDNRIMATGYAGSVSGQPHCDDVGHMLAKVLETDGKIHEHCIRTIHAEMNAIAQAAKYGISINDSDIYITMEPCFTCMKMLIQCGIKRIVCLKKGRHGELSRDLCKSAGIKLIVINDEVESY